MHHQEEGPRLSLATPRPPVVTVSPFCCLSSRLLFAEEYISFPPLGLNPPISPPPHLPPQSPPHLPPPISPHLPAHLPPDHLFISPPHLPSPPGNSFSILSRAQKCSPRRPRPISLSPRTSSRAGGGFCPSSRHGTGGKGLRGCLRVMWPWVKKVAPTFVPLGWKKNICVTPAL